MNFYPTNGRQTCMHGRKDRERSLTNTIGVKFGQDLLIVLDSSN